MNLNAKLRLFLVVPFILTVFFQNCASPVTFDEYSEPFINDGNGIIEPGEIPTTPPPKDPGVNTEVEVIKEQIVYPKLRLEPKPCIAGQMCEVDVIANETVKQDVIASWVTNDRAWQSNSAYAVPDRHYVPGSGQLKIPAGQSRTVIYVQSINFENQTNSLLTFRIPLTVSQCKYGTAAILCSTYFK